jgi:hypothetical protein
MFSYLELRIPYMSIRKNREIHPLNQDTSTSKNSPSLKTCIHSLLISMKQERKVAVCAGEDKTEYERDLSPFL